MPKPLTIENFVLRAQKIHDQKYDYSLVDFRGIKEKITVICPEHGKFYQTAEKHLMGRGCKQCGEIKRRETCLTRYGVENLFSFPKCKEKIRETMVKKYGVEHPIQNQNIKNRISETNLKKYGVINPFQNKNIIKSFVGKKDYAKIQSKIKNTVKARYGVISTLCLSKCKNQMLNKRRDSIVFEVFHGDRLQQKVIPLFEEKEYKDVATNYEWKCNTCKTNFFDSLDDGRIPRCPVCYPYIIDSQYEYEILDFLKSIYNGDIIHGDRKILNGQELDIYLPQEKLAIEFDGLYYHSEICGGKNKNYHLLKTENCHKQNIKLIHIFEDEWRKNKTIVKDRLKNLLHKTNVRVFARKCDIRQISSKESNDFLEQNHLQGKDNSSVQIGLFNNGHLVSIMTFGRLRIALGASHQKRTWEMYRFCCENDLIVVGGAGKLLNYFIVNYKPNHIISYADKRWYFGSLYTKIGFKKVSESPPNYFYTKDHYKRYHRFSFRKNILSSKLLKFNLTLSEWENMKNNGWDRIWDCGCIKFEWENSQNYPT